MSISPLDDLPDHRHVAGDRGSDARFIHTGHHDRQAADIDRGLVQESMSLI
jgi:hypothetical protein